MITYRVPILIRGYALVSYGQGRAAGDYMGGLPRDAEFEACNSVPFHCGSRMRDAQVELAGPAELVVDDTGA